MTDVGTLAEQLGQRVEQLTGTWSLDPAHTSAEFSVRHMMVATVRGRMQARSGTLAVDESADAERSYVEVEMDAASIDTGNADRDAHLRSADFLDVEKHPTITFRSREVDLRGDDELVVRGELTVKGVTRPITLQAELGGLVQDPWGNYRMGFDASATLERSEFGLTWNAALEGGGVVVGDRVKLNVNAEFVRPAPE